MTRTRLVACLLVRCGLVVQSIGFRRYRPVGRPAVAMEFLAKWDVDEIVLLDISATAENRGPDLDMLSRVSDRCFVPLTFGGGIRSVDDIRAVIRAGADKICTNAKALADPDFIARAADLFGSQCIVVSIDARSDDHGGYQVFADGGRRPTGLTPTALAATVERQGAGEIFLNSIDRDGSGQGYDVDLIRQVSQAVGIPVIACGGVGRHDDFPAAVLGGGASAAAAANIFHFIEHSAIVAKAHMLRAGVNVRLDTAATYADFSFDERGRLIRRLDRAPGPPGDR
jgi:imidazole glycerol-phosphate synthase subunit HisF